MSTPDVLVLPGDGIGPEVIAQALRVVAWINEHYKPGLKIDQAAIGGAAIDDQGTSLSEQTLTKARSARAVLLGAVGGPRWDTLPLEDRPESALLRLRSALGVFSNLRPVKTFGGLLSSSALKPERIRELDLLIVRELTGGIYFGQPRGIRTNAKGEREGFNTLVYSESEIRRVAISAFELARGRRRVLCSVDKANVLEVMRLWRDVVDDVAKDYPDVTLSHMYVDNCAMQLVKEPGQFDVIVTGNMFGDILSDCAAMLSGSIGLLASASLNEGQRGLYEPVHGSAPDIAGKDVANPLATVLSLALALRHSLGHNAIAHHIEHAVEAVLAGGARTKDTFTGAEGEYCLGCRAMGDALLETLNTLPKPHVV